MEPFDRDALRKVGKVFEHPGDKKKRRIAECATVHCSKKTHKTGSGSFDKYCSRCKARRQRVRNPLLYFYSKLKNRAKERGHSFTLTFEEWTRFCTEHNLLELRGKTANCLSVDRKRSSEGYYYANLKVLTVSENAAKGHADDEPDDPGDQSAPDYFASSDQAF